MSELKYTSKGLLLADANLRAYYRMEAGALTTDSSGNGKTLTNNNSIAENTAGKFGNCSDLGAANTNKHFSIADKLSYAGGAYSISFWVKLNAEIASGNWRFITLGDDVTDSVFIIRYDYNAGTRQLYFDRLKAGVTDEAFGYTITLGTSNWVHIVLTYNATTMIGYVNGANIGSVAASGSGSGAASAGFNIGSADGVSQFSSALFDDVACFNRVLTSAEVTELHNDLTADTNTLTNYRPRKRTPGVVSV